MKPSTKQEDYPVYFKHIEGCRLYAFIGPSKMYKIEAIGSNMNHGVTIDLYTTRKMVIKHWSYSNMRLTPELFKHLVTNLYTTYIDKMLES
jgi:hypothetical protein